MSFIPSKPHFFQPLYPHFKEKFLIPVSFFNYLKEGQVCVKLATLRSQRGKVWPVKINGRRFKDGWKEFAEDHELQVGDFVVFKHEGDLVFDVLVFDRSLCEREYVPFTNVKEEQVEIEIDIEEENVSEDSSTGKKLNTRSKPKASCSIHQQNNPKSSPAPIELQEHPAAKVAKGSGSVSGKSKASPSSAIQKRLFVANVTKWTTSVSKLYIPLKFSRLYFENRKYCKVILIDQEGRRWPTHLWNNGEQCHIADGWNEFRLANNLNPGDSFVFELIENGQKPVLKMCGVKASHRAASSSMEKPHFYLTVQISHLRTLQMKVPKKLASMSELAKSTGVIITNEKGKSWWVSTRLDKDDKVFLTSGWTELLKANGLEEGDVFMLELVKKGTTPQMKIYAFKQDMGSN